MEFFHNSSYLKNIKYVSSVAFSLEVYILEMNIQIWYISCICFLFLLTVL